MDDLDKLAEIAREAQEECPGEWVYDRYDDRVEHRDPKYGLLGVVSVDDNGGGPGHMSEAVGRHVACFSPDVVLRLIERVRELTRTNVKLESENRDLLVSQEGVSYESYKAGRRSALRGEPDESEDRTSALLDVYRNELRAAGRCICETCMRAFPLVGFKGFQTDSGRPHYHCAECWNRK